MGLESVGHDEDLDSKILQEIIDVMGRHMGGEVKPGMLSVEMAGLKPKADEGSPEEEAGESKLEELAEELSGEDKDQDDAKEGDEPLDLKSLEDELARKGLDKSGDDSQMGDDEAEGDDEFALRRKGKIF